MGTRVLVKIGRLCLPIVLFIALPLTAQAHVITVTDFRGKEITLNKPAKRIVCLIESALSGIYMLGKKDTLVAIPINIYDEGYFYKDLYYYYSLLDNKIKDKKLPAVGNWETVNIEAIISLNPDLVIIWSEQKAVIKRLEDYGIPVYGVFIRSVEDIYKEILDFGKLLDAQLRAKELIKFVKDEITALKALTNKLQKKKVYFMWAQHSPLHTGCGGSMVNELIEEVGGINICKHINLEATTLNIEQIIKYQPDVIIMWYSKSLTPELIIQNKQFQQVRAVRHKQIYQIDETFMYDMWTLKFLYTLKFIATSIHPQLANLDIKKEKKRLLKKFYSIDERH